MPSWHCPFYLFSLKKKNPFFICLCTTLSGYDFRNWFYSFRSGGGGLAKKKDVKYAFPVSPYPVSEGILGFWRYETKPEILMVSFVYFFLKNLLFLLLLLELELHT